MEVRSVSPGGMEADNEAARLNYSDQTQVKVRAFVCGGVERIKNEKRSCCEMKIL